MIDPLNRRWSRAQRFLADGQFAAARATLESLLQREAGHVPAQLALSRIAKAENRIRVASMYALTVAQHLPADESLVIETAEILRQLGETVASRRCLDHPGMTQTNDGALLMAMAINRKLLGEHPEALALFDRAAAAGMRSAGFRFQRAQELMFNGRFDEADTELRTCLRLAPCHGQAALALARLRKQTPQDNHLHELGRCVQDVEQGSEDHAALEFARYKEFEDLARHDEAWRSLAHANAIMYRRLRHDPELASSLFDHLIERCTPDFLRAVDTTPDGPQPIFIIGMPRSGTTLLERVLSNHSQVTSAGELGEFGLQLRWVADHGSTLDEHVVRRLPDLDYAELGRRYLEQTQWRAHGARFFIDKMPRNWMVAGLIHRALPRARILNLVRDPMDVCFSNFRTQVMGDLLPWGYDLHALAQHYKQYRRVLAHWHMAMPGQILDVSYRELTSDPDTVARKVLAHCGLEWEANCADITRNRAAVATLSLAQVREPIHTRFSEAWRNYEQQLKPLLEAITT